MKCFIWLLCLLFRTLYNIKKVFLVAMSRTNYPQQLFDSKTVVICVMQNQYKIRRKTALLVFDSIHKKISLF